MHIAVVGNIGAGKTTLTNLLAKHYQWEAMYEHIDNNPYIEDFYADMQRWSFNLQVFFLNSRFKQVTDIAKSDKSIIQDRTIYEDAYIFAENLFEMELMTQRDYQNYMNIFDNITSMIRPPDLLVYLKASVPTLVNNIQKRGREYESSIRIDYLSKLNEKYDKWINNYQLGKLLVLDKDRLDFTQKPEDLGEIIYKIDSEIHGLFK